MFRQGSCHSPSPGRHRPSLTIVVTRRQWSSPSLVAAHPRRRRRRRRGYICVTSVATTLSRPCPPRKRCPDRSQTVSRPGNDVQTRERCPERVQNALAIRCPARVQAQCPACSFSTLVGVQADVQFVSRTTFGEMSRICPDLSRSLSHDV